MMEIAGDRLMRLLVSACLLGLDTRYDGMDSRCEDVLLLAKAHTLIPVCPEQLGGMPTPRPPCELRCGRAVARDGRDFTEAFRKGAESALSVFRICGCDAAVLKQRSPSCGNGLVYDGSFRGVLKQGHGFSRKG